MVSEEWNSQILMNWPITIVPKRTGSNAKKLGLKQLQLPDMGASIRPPDGASLVHRRKNDLHIQQSSVSDGKVTSCLGEDIILPVFGQPFF